MSKIVVYYQQHWLPDFEGLEPNNIFNIKSFREVEVVLEPQILTICLLRKVYSLKMALRPCLYDSFYDGELPASLASNTISSPITPMSGNTSTVPISTTSISSGTMGETNSNLTSLIESSNSANFGSIYDSAVSHANGVVLRNEQLIRYLVTLVNLGINLNSTQLQSDFFQHYPIINNCNVIPNVTNTSTVNTTNTSSITNTGDRGNSSGSIKMDTVNENNGTFGVCTSSKAPKSTNTTNSDSSTCNGGISSIVISGDRYSKTLLVSYIYSHFRHCVLYLIWLHPLISSFTFNVIINSEPVPFAYYSFLRKRLQVRHECNQFGYSNIYKVMRDLRFILEGARVAISQKYYENHTLNDVCWFEGHIFSNLCVLFSLPCKDLEDLLCLHQDFNDLKRYCININSRYDVVSLKPPFLCGDSMATTEFKATLIWYLFKVL